MLLAPLWRWLGGAAAAALALLGIWAAGKREGRQQAAQKGLQDYQDTRERIDHADVSRGSAADDADWLRDRAKR